VLFHQRRSDESGSAGVRCYGEEWGVRLLAPFGIALDDAVERCVAVLMYLPALCRSGI
jgi:hypothetical protein